MATAVPYYFDLQAVHDPAINDISIQIVFPRDLILSILIVIDRFFKKQRIGCFLGAIDQVSAGKDGFVKRGAPKLGGRDRILRKK